MTDEMIKAEFEKPLTKEQMNEINKAFTHYIFYQREDRTPTAGYVGFCTYCRRHFSAGYSEICTDGHTLKHRDYAKCPLCGFTGTLFHINRGKKTLTECRRVVVFRKTDKDNVFAQGFCGGLMYYKIRQIKCPGVYRTSGLNLCRLLYISYYGSKIKKQVFKTKYNE